MKDRKSKKKEKVWLRQQWTHITSECEEKYKSGCGT
jgi:hypothetical protein